MLRLTRFVPGGLRGLLVMVPLALGACTAVVEEPYYRQHRTYYGPAFGGPVVVVPGPRYHYRDRHHHHHDRHHRRGWHR